MCLIFFAIDVHPDYPLIVAANRDEFFQRPTLPLHAWEGSPVIAGKDLTGGGTWMGITREGRFAALTNFRDPEESVENPLSRGLLVKHFLQSQQPAPDYIESIARERHRYPGFNLVAGIQSELWYFSNKDNAEPTIISPGIHGLSNHLLDTPWPKVTAGIQDLGKVLTKDHNIESLTGDLFEMMDHRQPAPDDQLPDTGVGKDFERVLSSRFIHAPGVNYGTRCSTVLQLGKNKPHNMFEKTWDSKGKEEDFVSLVI